MTTKNVNKFIQELADYINNFIVGTDNTVITNCQVMDKIMNRGHMIPIIVKPIEGVDKNRMLGPVFYAEELMEENKGSSIAAIAERLNVSVNAFYEDLKNLMKAQDEALGKTLDDYGINTVIVSSSPTPFAENDLGPEGRPFAMKEYSELGLTSILKGEIYTKEVEGGSQGYFAPISETEDHPATEEAWEQANLNTLSKASIQLRIVPVLTANGFFPVCGEIVDANEFYDYFYMLSVKPMWESLLKDMHVKDSGANEIYIFPQGPYSAKFVLHGGKVEENGTAQSLRSAFMEAAVPGMAGLLNAYVLDIETMEIRKVKRK